MFNLLKNLFYIFLITFAVIGCSGGAADLTVPNDLTAEIADASNRIPWGFWEIEFDPTPQKVVVTPAREVSTHYNITDWLLPPACDECLTISVNSYDQVTHILDADVTLWNPTQMPGYDVRGILYSNDIGYVLENPDARTPLYDIPGGDNVNPFRAFAKGIPHRIFFPNKAHVQKYLIRIPPPPQWSTVKFAVDASWPSNCQEPYAYENFIQGNIHEEIGSTGDISIDVLDWQNDVTEVVVRAYGIIGDDFVPMTNTVGNTWTMEVTNNLGAVNGPHTAEIIARSANPGNLALHHFVDIMVGPYDIEFNPVDVTPGSLIDRTRGICIEGDYAYVACYENKLHIYDITVSGDPVFLKTIPFDTGQFGPPENYDVAVAGGYAYVASKGLAVVDVDPPESAHFVGMVELYFATITAFDVELSGDYAYVGTEKGLAVVDISQPESATTIGFVNTDDDVKDIALTPGYALMGIGGQSDNGFYVADIDPPEYPHLTTIIDIPGQIDNPSVEVAGDYAYLGADNLYIYDISFPEDPILVNTLNSAGGVRMKLTDGYAYVIDRDNLMVIDIDPPEEADIVQYVHTPEYLEDVDVSDGHAYITNINYGLHIVDISSPESAYLVDYGGIVIQPHRITIEDDLAYVADGHYGFKIMNIATPETAYVIRTVDEDSSNNGTKMVAVGGDHAYVAYANSGMFIINVNPPAESYLMDVVDEPNWVVPMDIALLDSGYAAMAVGWSGLGILDVDPIDSVEEVITVTASGFARSIAVEDGYAFLGVDHAGVVIIDIDPLEDATVVKTVEISSPYIYRVVAKDGMVYATSSHQGLHIIDIYNPEEAYILKTVNMPYGAQDVAVVGGYAIVAGYSSGLQFVDITPSEGSHIVGSYQTIEPVHNVTVAGSYAYASLQQGGVSIIKLW